jgi:spore maturation protein SpmB
MNVVSSMRRLAPWLGCGVVLYAVSAVLLRPAVCIQGVAQGLSLCCRAVIPTLFPFLVLSQLLLGSPLAPWLGVVLRPFTRALGIGSARAPTALLCGLLGGFAAGAKSIDHLYRTGDITADEAQRLLLCAVGSSPAFVVGSVGAVMLGSAHTGWLLLGAQTAANFLVGAALCRFGFGRRKQAAASSATAPSPVSASPLPDTPPSHGFADAVASGVHTMSLLCGYITLFCFFCAIVVPPQAAPWVQFLAALPLEVTAACTAGAAATGYPTALLCSGALSLLGACAFLQVRALLHPHVAVWPVVLSRFAHLPVAAFVFCILNKLFPHATPTAAALWPSLVATQMPADVICVMFVLCALVFGAAPHAPKAPHSCARGLRFWAKHV